ncbi:MAG: type III pantothenate kinase, partial [Lutibacter sp.]|nr:type III pantothenate kinase [Lutibacter sp.]
MYLIIDVGNTRTKLAVFDRQELICSVVCTKVDLLSRLEEILQKYTCTKAILAAVGGLASPERDAIHTMVPLLELNHTTVLPFHHQYATPDTLGVDRIALVSGAVTRFPGKPVLVIDAGTCITYDFVDRDGIYRGGGISPGLQTRYKSLHTFTNNLPNLKASMPKNLVGNTTQESMHAGVVYGLLFEIDGF